MSVLVLSDLDTKLDDNEELVNIFLQGSSTM